MRLVELTKVERHERKTAQILTMLPEDKYPISNAAMNFAATLHVGTRKDGETPEFYHQVSIVRVLKKFEPNLIYPDETIATGFLHDVYEDYDVQPTFLGTRFGPLVGKAVDILSKKTPTMTRNEHDLYVQMADSPISSVVKGVDRVHNQSTMGIFTQDKKNSYMDYTDALIIPMLLRAKSNFPTQGPIYDSLLRILGYQKSKHYVEL